MKENKIQGDGIQRVSLDELTRHFDRKRVKRGTPKDISLVELRKLAKLTQSDIAEKIGVAQSNISNTENRKNIGISDLQEYILAIDASVEILITFENKQYKLKT